MGYLYYGFYALYYEQGRTEAIRQLGFTYKQLEERGIMMPVVEMKAEYYRPAYYDDLITVKTTISVLDKTGTGITFLSQLYNEAGKLINEGTVKLVFVDAVTKRKTAIPEILYERLKPFFIENPDH